MLAASACETRAHPAQLEVRALPAGTRELERQGRQVPDGHRRLAGLAARSRCWRICRRTTRTAPAASTSTRRGGCTRSSTPASSISRAAITSRSAAGGACRASARMASLASFAGGYGRKFKEDMRRYYGSFIGLSRPRRDDPEREFLLRDRSGGQGPLGHSRRCASTGSGRTTRRARPRTCRRPSPRSSRRWAGA